ncbi:MAG: sn-glycerol-1-phosphate dehydrogenase [Chloroflexota bacterium]
MRTTLPVYIGKDAIAKLIQYCDSHQLAKFTLVADQNTYPILGQAVETALASRGLDVNTIVLTGKEIIADEYYIVQVLLRATREDRVYLAVGSGTLTDITRFVSHRTKATFISVPSAPSVDGFTSGTASLGIGKLKRTVNAHPPIAIFADLPTLCAAPRAMIAAGFGDMLGKFTSLADWRLGHLLWDEPYDERIAQRTRKALLNCVSRVEAIGKASDEGAQSLMEGLIESGFCMMEAGYSRPAAGAEHYLSHFWEMKLLREDRPAILHGAKVGVACIMVAKYYDQIRRLARRDVIARLEASALPNRDQEIQRIREGYAAIVDQVVAEQAPFLNLTEPTYALLKRRIEEHWAEIQDIAATVPPAEELTRLLGAVGGSINPAMLGLSEEETEQALKFSHYFRNRFTVFKLNQILGLA